MHTVLNTQRKLSKDFSLEYPKKAIQRFYFLSNKFLDYLLLRHIILEDWCFLKMTLWLIISYWCFLKMTLWLIISYWCAVLSRSVMSDSCPWNSPGRKTGVGRHSLLKGIFQTQVISLVAGRFFTVWATMEASTTI